MKAKTVDKQLDEAFRLLRRMVTERDEKIIRLREENSQLRKDYRKMKAMVDNAPFTVQEMLGYYDE